MAVLIRRLAPAGPDWRALDLGCGNGELLLRLCETFGVAGDGVERDADGERARLRASAEWDEFELSGYRGVVGFGWLVLTPA